MSRIMTFWLGFIILNVGIAAYNRRRKTVAFRFLRYSQSPRGNAWSTMALRDLILAIITFFAVLATASQAFTTQVQDFNNELQKIRDDVIGVDDMQEKIDLIAFEEIGHGSGSDRIDELAHYISETFVQLFDAVRRIQAVAVGLYENGTIYDPSVPVKYCCRLDTNTSDFEYNQEFGFNISSVFPCIRANNTSNDVIYPTSPAILDVFSQNANRMSSLKWQYIGTEQGVHVDYPANNDGGACGDYDPRLRPWYPETATSIPKDVVIAIVRSNSMKHDRRLTAGQDAAKIVVDTLNSNDKVGVIIFSSEIKTPEGRGENCYLDDMAFATPYVKNFFKEYIDGITVDDSTEPSLNDSTEYIPPLKKAFSYFTVTENRRMVILFLTDGRPSEEKSDILNELKELNAAKENKVLLLTYGLDYNDTDGLLKDMAEMKGYDPSAGNVTKGEFTYISVSEDKRTQMASYYSYFTSVEHLDHPVVTVPYTDFSDLGHILSVCLPLASDRVNVAGTSPIPNSRGNGTPQLIGASCVDMTLRDITNKFEYLQRSSNAYVFMIDKTGRTILHPMLPVPGLDPRSDPLFVDIQYFEPDAEAAGILESMKALENGTETILASLITNRGFAPLHGVKNERLTTTYIWRAVQGTHFSVAMVQTNLDVHLSIETTEVADTFLYHKFFDETQLCNHHGIPSTLEYATTQFSAQAIKENKIEKEDAEFVSDLTAFMTNRQLTDDTLNDGIRELYFVTSQMIPEWQQTMNEYDTVLYERFVASESGMFTVYPGTTMPDLYDHTTTDWYNVAYSNKDHLVFIPPRKTEFGRTEMVTIAHTLLEGKQVSHTSDDATIGVMGMNVDASFMQLMLYKHVPECGDKQFRCMLIDRSGFAIYHPAANRNYSHIAQLEPEIAFNLQTRMSDINKPTIHKCDDFAWKKQYITWYFDIQEFIDGTFYQLMPFDKTNLFLIIRVKDETTTIRGCDSCSVTSFDVIIEANPNEDDVLTPECERVDSLTCNCPCHSLLNYEPCENRFNFDQRFEGEKRHPVCSRPVFPNLSTSTVTVDVGALSACFPVNCSTYATEFDCRLRTDCEWFPGHPRDGVTCFLKGTVFPTQAPEKRDSGGGGSDDSGGSSAGAIAGSVVAILFLLALIGVGVFLFLKYRKRDPPKFLPDNETYNPNENPIYDELHYVAPSSLSQREPKTSASSTSPSGPLGVMNPAFNRHNTSFPNLDAPEPPSLKATEPPIEYSRVLTDQYLTHGNVAQALSNGTNDTSKTELQSSSPPHAHLQLETTQPPPLPPGNNAMSYHGSHSSGNDTDRGSNLSYSTQRSNRLDKTNSLEPQSLNNNDTLRSDLGRYVGPNNDSTLPKRNRLHHETAIADLIAESDCRATPPPRSHMHINDMYIGNRSSLSPGLPSDQRHSTSQQERYLPMDRNSSNVNASNLSTAQPPPFDPMVPHNNREGSVIPPYAAVHKPPNNSVQSQQQNDRANPNPEQFNPNTQQEVQNPSQTRHSYDHNSARNKPTNQERVRLNSFPHDDQSGYSLQSHVEPPPQGSIPGQGQLRPPNPRQSMPLPNPPSNRSNTQRNPAFQNQPTLDMNQRNSTHPNSSQPGYGDQRNSSQPTAYPDQQNSSTPRGYNDNHSRHSSTHPNTPTSGFVDLHSSVPCYDDSRFHSHEHQQMQQQQQQQQQQQLQQQQQQQQQRRRRQQQQQQQQSETTNLPPHPSENYRIQFLSATPSFTRSHGPGENSDGASSRGSLFSSYI